MSIGNEESKGTFEDYGFDVVCDKCFSGDLELLEETKEKTTNITMTEFVRIIGTSHTPGPTKLKKYKFKCLACNYELEFQKEEIDMEINKEDMN